MKIKSKKWTEREKLRIWRNEILKRDKHKCVICGNSNKPNCHHIIPKQFENFRYDVENGIALCFNHHRVGKFSPHQNTLWFNMWLNTHRKKQLAHLLKKIVFEEKWLIE